jgi:transposase
VATVGTGKQFGSGRDFAAWLGLTPLNRSGGGRERLGRISTPLMVCRQTTAGQWMGDRYIRRLLVLGMMSRMRQITKKPERYDPWVADILARKPGKVAAVAITAREG